MALNLANLRGFLECSVECFSPNCQHSGIYVEGFQSPRSSNDLPEMELCDCQIHKRFEKRLTRKCHKTEPSGCKRFTVFGVLARAHHHLVLFLLNQC